MEDPLALAIGALRRRERSCAELANWLARKGVTQVDIDAVLAELIELGELDDAQFARRFAEDKRELSGWGAERIRAALSARGIDAAEIEAAVESERGEELARAAELLERRNQRLDSDGARHRALAFLTRRGFPYELAYDAVRAAEREAA